MLVSVVVLINLLIAMMTDTYQRIQVNAMQPCNGYDSNIGGSAVFATQPITDHSPNDKLNTLIAKYDSSRIPFSII